MIRASDKVLAVIGNPIEHSLSPVLQNWLIQQFGLKAVYTAFRVQNNQLESALTGMKALGIHGLNVTVPHKLDVLKFVDKKSPQVKILQAANTLHFNNGYISAHVTDPIGFIDSLQHRAKFFKDADVLLLGAGGSAQSIAFALGQLDVRNLYIYNRTFSKAVDLAKLAEAKFQVEKAQAIDSKLNEVIGNVQIIINTTSVGMHPNIDDCPVKDFSAINRNHFVYDLIYNPFKTKLLQQAELKSADVQNGLDMLIFQGLASLRIWFEQDLQLDSKQLNECRTLLNRELR